LGVCAVWVVQLAINASSESVVTCLIMCREAPFDDGGHGGRQLARMQQ
jgi:hypothetical protein